MSDNLDLDAGSFSHRSFRMDDAEASYRNEISPRHSRQFHLDGSEEIMLEDEPERFVTFND